MYFKMAAFFVVLACLVLRSHESHAEQSTQCHAQEVSMVFGSNEGYTASMIVETRNITECYEFGEKPEYPEYTIILRRDGVDYLAPDSCGKNIEIEFGRIYGEVTATLFFVRFIGINIERNVVETRVLYLGEGEGEVRCSAICQGMACTLFH